MSHHQLGRQEDALAALHRGTQILGGLPREEEAHSGLGWFGTAWTLWIEAHAARREAEALTGSHAGAGASTRPADVQKPAAAD